MKYALCDSCIRKMATGYTDGAAFEWVFSSAMTIDFFDTIGGAALPH